MDDLMDMMMSGEGSATDVSDKIKEILYAKAAEKIDAAKPAVGASLFGDEVADESDEVVDEVEVESEEDEEETQTGDEDVD